MKTKHVVMLSIGVVVLAVTLLVATAGGGHVPPTFVRQFQSFSLTVDNQSGAPLTALEIGTSVTGDSGQLVTGDSWQPESREIASGRKRVFKPQLSHSGEGGIYMRYVDASGKEVKTTVCSYTEHLSGYTDVKVLHDRVEVEQNCM